MHHLEIEDQERREAAIKRRIDKVRDERAGDAMAALRRHARTVGPAVDERAVDWSQAPEWANFWAMDDDGRAFWFENKPTLREDALYAVWSDRENGLVEKAPNFIFPATQFRESLCARNANEEASAFYVDWSQAPEWANYWAMDDDGEAYWFEEKPTIDWGVWLSQSRQRIAPDFGGAAIDWQDSLVARPAAIKDRFTTADTVDHPAHYANQGGIECIEVLEQLAADGHDFRILNAIKYLWRYRHKGGDESLRKARWYIERVLGES